VRRDRSLVSIVEDVDIDAAHHPFWNVMWTFFLIWIWVSWLWLLISVVSDVYRRPDLSGAAKASWTIIILLVPFIGALVYLATQGDTMSQRRGRRHNA
jgi:hypothetical protein